MTRFLVDANVLSEATRPSPDAKVLEWLRANERELAVDPIILGELRYGILLLPKGKRRTTLEKWFSMGVERLVCVEWTRESGLRWAALLADLRARGESMPVKDSLIAATALTRNLVVATRNVADFKKARMQIHNPFD
jgi:predicted nucleic acid-binding protein